MGIRNKKRQVRRRLDSKTLDAQFIHEIQHGLNCSPFEAEAVLDVVKEIYFPFLDQQPIKVPPGKVTLIAVSADEPTGKPVTECEKQNVCLMVHRGSEDDRILQEQGPAGFRQSRIPDICQEALKRITNDPHPQIEPAIAIGTDNTAYIVWTDARNFNTDIYGTKSTSWVENPLVNTNSNQWSPAVAISDDGILHLLWIDDENSFDDIFYGNNENSLPFVGISIVDEANTNQSNPSIIVNGTKVFASWQDTRNVVNNNADMDIYYAETSSSDFGTNILINDDIGTYTQTSPAIGIDKDGNPYKVWVDNRLGNNSIYYAGAMSVGPALASGKVNANNGGTVAYNNTLQVNIPSGALPTDTKVTIAEMVNPPETPTGIFWCVL